MNRKRNLPFYIIIKIEIFEIFIDIIVVKWYNYARRLWSDIMDKQELLEEYKELEKVVNDIWSSLWLR